MRSGIFSAASLFIFYHSLVVSLIVTSIFTITICISYNHFHNNLRLFDVLPNFHITTSETMRDY